MDFKEEWNWLNSYQMEAVTDENDACIVNANVGSGKTTVLIAKILYLHYEKKIPLEKMVVLTFTNKAAGEIIERLKKKEPGLTEEQVQFFGTFHSVAMRMLKNTLLQAKAENEEIAHTVENSSMAPEEWTSEFEIIDPDEEQELALCLIAEYSLKVKYKNRLKKRLEQEYPNYKAGKVTSRYKDELFRLYPLLQKEKKKENKMSFSDLLEEGTRLLKMGKNSRPEWIIVDEVQDSDRSQLEFLEALKGPETKIFAVGDPNQVIYSFRGTTQNMFFLLKNRFQAKELSLPVNYRSNASILEAANRFLQFGGKIQGSNECGEKIQIRNHYDPFQEAMYLADKIWTLHQEGKEYRDIAVFNWLMYVLRFATHPDDIQAGMQVLMDKRFGDKCTKKKAEDIIKNHKTEKSDIYKNMMLFYTEKEVLSGEDIFDSLGLKEALHPTSADYQQDAKQVLDFLNQICTYSREKKLNMSDGIREFLNGMALGTIESPEDTQESAEKEEAGGRVKLMTLHAS